MRRKSITQRYRGGSNGLFFGFGIMSIGEPTGDVDLFILPCTSRPFTNFATASSQGPKYTKYTTFETQRKLGNTRKLCVLI